MIEDTFFVDAMDYKDACGIALILTDAGLRNVRIRQMSSPIVHEGKTYEWEVLYNG